MNQNNGNIRNNMNNPLFPALRSGHRLFQRPWQKSESLTAEATPRARIGHWLGVAVVFSVAVTPLAAATPDLGTTSSAAASDPAETVLWYRKPAVKWEEAMAVGNGRLGAMVFGGTAEERLQFNESTLWGGLPHDYSNPEAGQHLAELRRLIFAGHIPEAEKLGDKMLGNPGFQRPYQPLGDLRLRFPGHEQVEQYVRALDLDQALVLCAATSFKNYQDVSANPRERLDQAMAAACAKTFAQLRQNHLTEYQPLFRRVAVDLGTSPAAALPTDRRIGGFTKQGDPALVALYYQFGRYLLLASSRPGGQAANLQGLWNQELWPSWSSKWTCNINAEMNYWAAETANLPECHEPLFDLIDDLRVAGRKTAKEWYGCRGFVVHHNTDLWRGTAPVDGAWGLWPMGGVWLVQHLWDHYAFSGDREFLRQRAYPAMKESAQFVLDFLTEAPPGTAFPGALVTNPSYSPENSYKLPNGGGGSFTYAATMDLQLIGELFGRCITAAAILGVDAGFSQQLEAARRRLPPLQIGRQGQLQEWIGDWDMTAPDQGHRHLSHLYAMMPGQTITPRETPRYAAAVRKSLELRGDGGMGWSKAWKVGLWARLGEGDRALSLVEGLIRGSTLPSMLDNGPPFQIDGNFGGCAGIGEMLLQSRAAGEATLDDASGKLRGGSVSEATIDLLPALPMAWPTGSARGLRARGGFEVDCTWRDGRLTGATIRSKHGGACRIRYRDKMMTLETKAGQSCRLDGELKF
jgi:alpha-L-fucosidase 2